MNSKLKAALSGELQEYRSVPFRSWNNSLDENELVKQIVEMKAAGIGMKYECLEENQSR